MAERERERGEKNVQNQVPLTGTGATREHCSFEPGSTGHSIRGVFPEGTSPESLCLYRHCGTPPCG